MAILATIISLISLAIAIMSWHKNRVVYNIEELVVRKIDGTRNDTRNRWGHITKKLKTGQYAIASVQDRRDGDWAILLAQVRKEHTTLGWWSYLKKLIKVITLKTKGDKDL